MVFEKIRPSQITSFSGFRDDPTFSNHLFLWFSRRSDLLKSPRFPSWKQLRSVSKSSWSCLNLLLRSNLEPIWPSHCSCEPSLEKIRSSQGGVLTLKDPPLSRRLRRSDLLRWGTGRTGVESWSLSNAVWTLYSSSQRSTLEPF